MNEPFHTITVKLLDRDFKVKCPLDRVNDLQESAAYLDTKMKEVMKLRPTNCACGFDL